MNRALHRFAIVVAVCTFVLLIAGALVTSNDAGLSVPDWPLSYGSLAPPMVGGIVYEHSHRVAAATVGLLTIVLAAWIQWREPRGWVRRLGWSALAVVIVQGILGGITVLFYLPLAVSVAHAALAQVFFSTVVTIALVTSRWWLTPVTRTEDARGMHVRHIALWTVVALLIQLLLGALFRHRGFGFLPHVVGAVIVAWMVYSNTNEIRHRFGEVPALVRSAAVLRHLVTVQLILGGAALWSRLTTSEAPQPMPVMVLFTVVHTAFGALVLAAAVVLTLVAYRTIRPVPAVALGTRPEQVAQ